MPRDVGGSKGGGRFFMCEVPLYVTALKKVYVSRKESCVFRASGIRTVCQIGCTSLERLVGPLGEFFNRELYRTVQFSIQ